MNLLEIEINTNEKILDQGNLGDLLMFGGEIVLIGMLTIFAVLSIIWGFLVLFKYAFQNTTENNENSKVVPSPVQNAALPITNIPADDEIIAVIAAAIATAESENSGLKFKVVSFRRK